MNTNERSSADQVAGQPQSISLSQVSLNRWCVLFWERVNEIPQGDLVCLCSRWVRGEEHGQRGQQNGVLWRQSVQAWHRQSVHTKQQPVLCCSVWYGFENIRASTHRVNMLQMFPEVLDPLGSKTHISELGTWAVLFLSSAKEDCVKTWQFIIQSSNAGWPKTYEAATWLWLVETLGAASIDVHAWLWVTS